MATLDQTAQVHLLADRKRWLRFALELAIVSAILLGLIAYFAKSPSPEVQRETLLEAIRLTLAEPPNNDPKQALWIALKLADIGNRDAQVLAGILFGLGKDGLKATEQLRKAEAAGSLYACRRLTWQAQPTDVRKLAMCGDPLWQGIIGRGQIRRDQPDPVSGVAFLEAGVKNGDALASRELGRLYGFGIHLPKDVAKARELLRYALDRGEAEAGFYLWTLSLAQRTTSRYSTAPQPTDDIAACYKAAELGHPMCQRIVAVAQGLGEGLPQDDVAAYMWFNLAAANAEADDETREIASKLRERMRRFLSPAQIAEAQRLTREWKRKKVDEPEEPPLVEAIRELRDEMDGKFPAIPKLPSKTIPPAAAAPPTTVKPEPNPELPTVVAPSQKVVNPASPSIAAMEAVPPRVAW